MIRLNPFRKRYVSLLLVAMVLYWFSNSFQFRMSDEVVNSYFENGRAPLINYLVINDQQIRYLWLNNKQATTVVFVHGAPGSSSAFIDFFKNEKLNSNFNLISLDRPGYGQSGFGQTVPSLGVQANVIDQISDHLQLDRTILVGHSLGAPIIAQAALDNPEKFDALLFVAGSVDPSLEPKEWYRPWLRNGLMKAMLPATFYTTNEEIYHLKDQLTDLEPRWKELKMPVIVIQGEADRLVPKENAIFLRNQIPEENCEIWLEQDVNHFIPWNRPDLIVNAVLKLDGK